jgi:hypothetical protein
VRAREAQTKEKQKKVKGFTEKHRWKRNREGQVRERKGQIEEKQIHR